MSTSIEALAMAGADYNEFSISFEEWERDEIMKPPPPHLLASEQDDDEVTRYFKNRNYAFSSAALSNFQKVDYEEWKRNEIVEPPPPHDPVAENGDDADDEVTLRFMNTKYCGYPSAAAGSNFQNQSEVSHLDEKNTFEAMMVAIRLKILTTLRSNSEAGLQNSKRTEYFKWLYNNVLPFVANLVCIALFSALN